MKPGTRFIHKFWLDATKQPLECIVTATRGGWVYWRAHDCERATMKFDEEKVDRYVREVLE